jgi:hypothetical protein
MTYTQLDILAGINTDPTPLGADERARILTAMRQAAAANHGLVSPNVVRKILTGRHGLTVNARRLSAAYRGPWVEPVGHVESDDVDGGNRGARIGLYRWTGVGV